MECPVCREPLAEQPERCFRCETRLGPWWELEGALARREAPRAAPEITTPRPALTTRLLPLAVGASLALGMVAGLFLRGTEQRPHPAAALAPAEAPASSPGITASASPHARVPAEAPPTNAPRGSVTYRAQRGDSLWRVAAAVTGDGRRWRELWPDRPSGRLVRNEVLLIPAVPERE